MTDLTYAIDDIKRALTCHDVAQRIGIATPPRKDAICPKHGGQSLRIKDDWWRCFGGCDAGGDVINLYMWHEGVDFMTALKQLADWAGVTLKLDPAAVRAAEQRRRVEDILGVAADFYASRYDGSPAQAYAQSRGLDVAEARLGYAPDEWRALADHLAAQGIDMAQAEEAGLVKKNSRGYYDHLRNRLIIPAYKHGRCVYLTGRALDDSKDEHGKRVSVKFLHVALDEPPLYHLNGALKPGSTPILTESVTDVLQFEQHHLPGVAVYGVALKDNQRRTLERFDTIYVAAHNDKDKQGEGFVNRCAEELGERIRVAPAPDGFKDWDEALKAGEVWAPDESLTWFRWRLRAISPSIDLVTGKKQISPLLDYLATVDDQALANQYLDEMRQHFKWSRPIYLSYQKTIADRRKMQDQDKEPDNAHTGGEQDMGESFAPPEYISPALCEFNGTVYVSQMMGYWKEYKPKRGDKRRVTVYEPVLISSDRRRLIPKNPPPDAPPSEITWLDKNANIALRGGFYDAPSNRWSYPSIVSFLNGEAPTPAAHDIYTQMMSSLKRYVYHADETSYVVDVLWAMGTYFHQLWNAFPYLALHGHRGAGKSTLLTWLSYVCFNARFLVNTSEAALYRSIQAVAPTLLIDEQEGLNNSKEAKTNKVDLMGLLKSGYKRGAEVARQRIDRPEITEYFEVYSPKALAAIELFEDVLENRAILTIMNEKPVHIALDEADAMPNREGSEFVPIRDSLYLLLMSEAARVRKITDHVQLSASNRFRELFKPLYVMACLVDMSRGDGKDTVTAMLDQAAKAKATLRKERDDLTPDAMLREALAIIVANATDDPEDLAYGTRLPGGLIRTDELQIKQAFESLFSDTRQSFFNGHWLGKQATKIDGMQKDSPSRRRRVIKERDPQTMELETRVKQIPVYLINPSVLKT